MKQPAYWRENAVAFERAEGRAEEIRMRRAQQDARRKTGRKGRSY